MLFFPDIFQNITINIQPLPKMKFEKDNLYHIYNRGNNKQQIFFNSENYLYFLYKMRDYLRPNCDILAYCLMPNHFHFLINTNAESIVTKTIGSFQKNALSEGIRILLSSYTQAINKQENRVGSLFTQNTKCKCLTTSNLKNHYAFTCFGYTHQNPIRAGLVTRMEDWEYSSFRDYAQLRNGTMCNQELAYKLIELNKANFYQESYRTINDNVLQNIW